MVAPAPESGQTETNVTPLTTLVAFEPALKEKLDALGGWNVDIASSSGVSGNLLRIAKTVETLSSTLSGGSSPVVSNLSSNLKSLGKLATTLNKASGDLASDAVLKASTSSAIEEIISDPVLVPEPPSATQRAAIKNSSEQAVQGIAAAIPATDEVVVEDASLLAKVEKVLKSAGIAEEISITLNMGSGSTLSFGAVITTIKMNWVDETSLVLTAETADDDPGNLDYRWFTFSQTLEAADPSLSTIQIPNFNGTINLKVLLTVIDSAANTSDTRSCTWQSNPTICEF